MTDKNSDDKNEASAHSADEEIGLPETVPQSAEAEGEVEGGSEKDARDSAVEAAHKTKGHKEEGESAGATDAVKSSRQLSISVRNLLVVGLIVALVAGIGVLAWLYVGAKRELDAVARQAADEARAEQIALDYATNAAAMNFEDIEAWKAKLVAGTSQELTDRLSKAADQMEQILVPLQWDSTARPLAAKVRSNEGTSYTVDAFVSVLTKTVQGPDPLQSTATYSVTIDTNQDWKITDVGGIGAAVGAR